jgi:hypothetical protein
MRLYRTPVGVISGLILFRLVTFWRRSAMGWSVPFSLGEFLVEGPLLARRLTLATQPRYRVAKRHLIAMLEGQSLTGPNQDDGPAELAAPQHTLPNLVELRDTFEQIPIAVR